LKKSICFYDDTRTYKDTHNLNVDLDSFLLFKMLDSIATPFSANRILIMVSVLSETC